MNLLFNKKFKKILRSANFLSKNLHAFIFYLFFKFASYIKTWFYADLLRNSKIFIFWIAILHKKLFYHLFLNEYCNRFLIAKKLFFHPQNYNLFPFFSIGCISVESFTWTKTMQPIVKKELYEILKVKLYRTYIKYPFYEKIAIKIAFLFFHVKIF